MITPRPPYLPFQQIAARVEDLRQNYSSLSIIPVNIEDFVEFDLGIELIPQQGVRKTIGADAYITRDFKSIVVDYDYFNSSKMLSRTRFSIAHELGHLFLHKEFYISQYPIDSAQEWFDVTRNFHDTVAHCLEWQADTFASLLLMPKDEIISSLSNGDSLNTMSRKFEVSPPAIGCRIDKDDLKEAISKFLDKM